MLQKDQFGVKDILIHSLHGCGHKAAEGPMIFIERTHLYCCTHLFHYMSVTVFSYMGNLNSIVLTRSLNRDKNL